MASDTLAHDINNLLAIVTGCCDRLTRQGDLTPEQRTELERIALAASHAGALAAQLMEQARGDDRPPEPRCNLNDALGAAARLIEQSLGDQIRLEVHPPAQPAWLRASEADVVQVLLNLSLNARDAMPAGGVLTIGARTVVLHGAAAETARVSAGEYASLEVRDTGTGMSAETKAHAFDPFFTARAGGGGMGLGLASVKRVIERRGGAIELESTPDAGTRFTLLLPLARRRASDATASLDPKMLRARGRETVLVVDDEPTVRELIVETLRGFGYHTLEAASAAAALPLAAGERIDLLVADVDLPDASGMDLAARIAADAPGLPTLVISGDHEHAEARLPRSAFLQKPFSGARLARTVRDLLDVTPSGTPAGSR